MGCNSKPVPGQYTLDLPDFYNYQKLFCTEASLGLLGKKITQKKTDHVVLLVPKVWIGLSEWGG